MNVSYFEAWGLWINGQQVQNLQLWGQSILFWDRCGKVLQFVVAMAILAEIIGQERIREFRFRLKNAITVSDLIGFFKLPFIWMDYHL